MPVNKQTFDADLTAFTTAVTDYIAAVTAFLALPQVVDLSSEDTQVQNALAAVNTAKAALPPPPAP